MLRLKEELDARGVVPTNKQKSKKELQLLLKETVRNSIINGLFFIDHLIEFIIILIGNDIKPIVGGSASTLKRSNSKYA